MRTVASCGACSTGSTCGTLGLSASTCVTNTPLPSGVCTPNNMCFQAPLPGNASLQAENIDADGTVWVAGDRLVAQINGSTIRGWYMYHSAKFTGIYTNGPNDVWVSAADCLVMHFNGSIWENVSIPCSGAPDLTAIAGSADAGVMVVGESGIFDRWTGTRWVPAVTSGPSPSSTITQLTVANGSEVHVGTPSELFSYGSATLPDGGLGGSLSSLVNLTGSSGRFQHLAAGGPGETWAASSFDHGSSSSGMTLVDVFLTKLIGSAANAVSLPSSTSLPYYLNNSLKVAARAGDDVWLMQSPHEAWHFDGSTWGTTTFLGAADVPFTAAASLNGKSIAVDRLGKVFQRTAAAWSFLGNPAIPPSSSGDFEAPDTIALSNGRVASTLFINGTYDSQGQQAFRFEVGIFDGTSWSANKSVNWYPALGTVTGSDLWVIDRNTRYSPTASLVSHFDGTTWSTPQPLGGLNYGSLTARTATDIWAGGDGTLAHYNGTSWSVVLNPYSGTSTSIGGIVVKRANLAFAKASDGNVLKWNGTTWSIHSASTNLYISDGPGTDIYGFGTTGLFRYDEPTDAWIAIPLPSDVIAVGNVVLISNTNVQVLVKLTGETEYATVLTWNGSAFTGGRERFPSGYFQQWMLAAQDGHRIAVSYGRFGVMR